MGKRILIVQQPGKGFFEKGKLKSILKKGGYTVVGDTTTREDYVNRFRWEKPDLVLLESFPFGDGEGFSDNIEALVNIRHAEDTVWSGPLVMYGRPGDNVDEDGREWMDEYLTRGIDDFILQPFEESELFSRIDRLLSLPKADVRTDDKMQVLIQQGNLSDRAWLNTVLERNGYYVGVGRLSEGSSPCLEYLKHHIGTSLEPDLLIAEDFTTLVRVRKEYPDIPVLICSYKNSLDYVEMCLRAGARDYLLKPFKPEEFLEKVSQICSPLKHIQPPTQPKVVEPSPPPEPEAVQTPYERKIAAMTPEELLAEVERIANCKVTDTIARVLVVQKTELMQNVIQDMLKKNNFEVTGIAADGWRCLELYRERKPNLVIMDTVLANGIDGIKILQLIRKENPSARVLMTGSPEENAMEACVQSGAKGFLAKPFKEEDLLKKVREALFH